MKRYDWPKLDWIAAFVAVVEQGNQRRAAAKLFVTQPTVSLRVAKLEGYLGRPLFADRADCRLSEFGREYYQRLAPLLSMRWKG